MRPAANLADLLARAAQESPEKVALVEAASGRRMTWAELDAEADRVAQGLSGLGLVAGYRVMIALTNRIEFVSTYFGALRARLVAVPVNPRSATGEMVRMMADCGARVVVADVGTVATVRAAVAGLEDALIGADEELKSRTSVPRVVVAAAPTLPGETAYVDLAGDGRAVPPPQDPEALAVLLYTSGTSGKPRAAMLTHRALVANVEQAAAVEPALITGDDVVLGVLPLFHVYGLNAVLGSVLRHRAKLLLVERWDPRTVLDVIEDEAVSVVPVAPPAFAHWLGMDDLAERLGPVRLVLSGSAPLPPDAIETFTAATGLPVHQGYGLTEAAPVVTSTLGSELPRPVSVGSPLPGVELRLVDDAGDPVSGGDPGQIWVRGDNLFSGYWPDGREGPDDDGWWPTGDVGLLDASGELCLVDRVKELVVVSGFNVYPSEVEEVVAEVPGVREVAVVGTPDERTGEAVVAYVVPEDGPDPARLAEAVGAHAATRLARFKQPSRVEVVRELPMTGTGKVQKGRLRGRERRRATALLE